MIRFQVQLVEDGNILKSIDTDSAERALTVAGQWHERMISKYESNIAFRRADYVCVSKYNERNDLDSVAAFHRN